MKEYIDIYHSKWVIDTYRTLRLNWFYFRKRSFAVEEGRLRQ